MSVQKAWKRLCDKNEPTESVKFSPIKPIQYHFFGIKQFFDDQTFSSHLWTLQNNEEFHYQNSGSLVYNHCEDIYMLRIIIRDNMRVVDWNKRLANKVLLGEGSFGKVFKAIDLLTRDQYALKIVKPPSGHDIKNLYSFLSGILSERNLMSELNRCIFFVRLLAAFQSQDTQFTLVLEFCVCDLQKLYSFYPHHKNIQKLTKYYAKGILMKKVRRKMSKMFRINFKDIAFMYFFEMLCGLHYLGTRHIIHADIKPDNILISTTGHIKIADLGLSFKNQWFNRTSAVMLPISEFDLQTAEYYDKNRLIGGTRTFFDPELHLFNMRKDKSFTEEIQRYYKDNMFFQTMTDVSQNFLSDLYAVGLTFLLLCLGGFNVLEDPIWSIPSPEYWILDIILDSEIRNKYLVSPLIKMSRGADSFSVMEILLSILQPRQKRAENFVTDKTILKNYQLFHTHFIDITKIENSRYYKSKAITKENVTNRKVSKNFIKGLTKTVYEKYRTDSESDESEDFTGACDKQVHRVHPFEYKY